MVPYSYNGFGKYAWLPFRKHQVGKEYMKLREFQALVAEGLVQKGKAKKGGRRSNSHLLFQGGGNVIEQSRK